MIQLRRIFFIAHNNLRLFLTDRLAVAMFLLFPFLFIIMFNLLLGNTGTEDTRMKLHLATRESDGISLHLIQAMATTDESKLAPGEPVIVWEKDYNQSRANVEARTLEGFLAFPADFTEKVMAGKNTNIEIVVQAEATSTRMALNGLAHSVSSSIGADTVEIKSVVALLTQQGAGPSEIQKAIASIIQSQSMESEQLKLITYQAENVGEVKAVNVSSFVVPGYLVMFVFFAAAIASVDIIKERQNHTLERLLASSVRKESLLGGIYLGAVFRGLVQIVIFWAMGILVFHVDLGVAPWATILISLLTVLMAAAFSVMLSTLVRTERSASAIAVLTSLLLAPLGGCWWPLFITPQWMQFLAKITPHGWANDGFNKLMLFGANAEDVVWPLVALAGFAFAFMAIAIINFRTSADAA
jgi:ABC-2 type transport system permease protein